MPAADRSSSLWLHRLRDADRSDGMRLLLFPPGGSNASAAWPLTATVPAEWSVWAVQYPARGPRLREPQPRSIREMATACQEAVLPDAPRTVLFGHSFGALVAYDLAQLLAARGCPAAGLLVAGSSAPVAGVAREYPEELDDATLIAFLDGRGGTPAELLANEELMALTLPALRVDMENARLYVDDHGRRLTTETLAVGARHDPVVLPEQMHTWREVTDRWLGCEMTDGNHFSFLRDSSAIAGILRRHWPVPVTVAESGSP
jgi:pyochelin biosynthesis protein PchC